MAVADLMKSAIDIYTSRETADILELSGHRLHILEPLKQVKIENLIIMPFELIHDVQNFGFLISNKSTKILYASDTNYIPYKFKSLTHIMLGVDYDKDILKEHVDLNEVDIEVAKRTLKNHMSLQTAIDFFKANDMSKVQEIYLLHLSAVNSDPDKFRSEIEKVTGRPVYI